MGGYLYCILFIRTLETNLFQMGVLCTCEDFLRMGLLIVDVFLDAPLQSYLLGIRWDKQRKG